MLEIWPDTATASTPISSNSRLGSTDALIAVVDRPNRMIEISGLESDVADAVIVAPSRAVMTFGTNDPAATELLVPVNANVIVGRNVPAVANMAAPTGDRVGTNVPSAVEMLAPVRTWATIGANDPALVTTTGPVMNGSMVRISVPAVAALLVPTMPNAKAKEPSDVVIAAPMRVD